MRIRDWSSDVCSSDLLRGDLLGQRVGHGLGDQGLAASGGPVEQYPLGRLELVLLEQLGVEVGQLDSVADLVDLADQAADRGVVDVRDLFEAERSDEDTSELKSTMPI